MDGKMSNEFTQQLSTEDHWQRHITHFRNWHGRCRVWKPLDSADPISSFRSCRSFQPTATDRSGVRHNVSKSTCSMEIGLIHRLLDDSATFVTRSSVILEI